MRRELDTEQRAFLQDTLRSIELFADVSAADLERVLDAMQERAVDADEYVTRQGEQAKHFFVRFSGEY